MGHLFELMNLDAVPHMEDFYCQNDIDPRQQAFCALEELKEVCRVCELRGYEKTVFRVAAKILKEKANG